MHRCRYLKLTLAVTQRSNLSQETETHVPTEQASILACLALSGHTPTCGTSATSASLVVRMQCRTAARVCDAAWSPTRNMEPHSQQSPHTAATPQAMHHTTTTCPHLG
jgi:hypothetical protein